MEASGESDFTPSNCLIWSKDSKITALFGKSGSGKSQTLRKQFELLEDNKIVGYLPKQIVLFDSFNAPEHLEFFGNINGISNSSA
jgi:ABC-type multidrug transport system ATPase subunit